MHVKVPLSQNLLHDALKRTLMVRRKILPRNFAYCDESYLDDVFREAETNDGQLGWFDDDGGHPGEGVGRECPEGHHEVGVLSAGRGNHGAQFGVGQ